jgi:prepilin peptidase CpaA
MNSAELIPIVLLVTLLAITSITDLLYCKIPNRVVFPAMVCGIIYFSIVSGLSGLMWSMGGIILGICLLLPLYLMGGMGAGDVKLMGAVGSILGPQGVLIAFLYSAIVGGIYALFLLARSKVFSETAGRYWLMAKGFLWTRQFTYIPPKGTLPSLCYGVAISLGTMLSVLRAI